MQKNLFFSALPLCLYLYARYTLYNISFVLLPLKTATKVVESFDTNKLTCYILRVFSYKKTKTPPVAVRMQTGGELLGQRERAFISASADAKGLVRSLHRRVCSCANRR